jgi:hypothetical protein
MLFGGIVGYMVKENFQEKKDIKSKLDAINKKQTGPDGTVWSAIEDRYLASKAEANYHVSNMKELEERLNRLSGSIGQNSKIIPIYPNTKAAELVEQIIEDNEKADWFDRYLKGEL